MQRLDLCRFLTLQPGEQEFSKKIMIPVPVTLGIQAGQEQVFLFKLIQDGLGMPDARQGVAGGGIHLGKDSRMGKECLFFLALPAENFLSQVLENIAIGTAQPGNETLGALGILALQRRADNL